MKMKQNEAMYRHTQNKAVYRHILLPHPGTTFPSTYGEIVKC